MAKLTRAQKLDRKGIFHIEIGGVLAYLSAKQSQDVEIRDKLRPLINAAPILIAHWRDRVRKGKFAEGTSASAYGHGKMSISPEYAKLAGTDRLWWWSSAAFHSAVNAKAGTGWVTGGMWAGAQARGKGKSSVVIEFSAQRTPGRGERSHATGVGKDGKPRRGGFMHETTVKAREKAYGVFRQGVNVLEPQQAEMDAIAGLILADAQAAAMQSLTGESRSGTLIFGGDPALRAKLAVGWR